MFVRCPIYHYHHVTSTNDVARTTISTGCPAPFVICAQNQSAGRGRNGHIWESFRGNVMASIVVGTQMVAASSAAVSLAVGLAVGSALRHFDHTLPIALKWPNDVLILGQKVAGILIEVYKNNLIIGIGVNLARAPAFTHTTATSLCAASIQNLKISPALFLQVFLASFDAQLDFLQERGQKNLCALWQTQAAYLGEQVHVRRQNQHWHGIFTGITDAGHLCLMLANNHTRTFAMVNCLRPINVAK